jgi:hypothetical protein
LADDGAYDILPRGNGSQKAGDEQKLGGKGVPTGRARLDRDAFGKSVLWRLVRASQSCANTAFLLPL